MFSSNVTETEEDCVVDGYAIIEENSDNLLDVFEAFINKDGILISRGCVLEFAPKCRLYMGAGEVLFSEFEVAEHEESGGNISGHS